jgi:uncharacterized protein (UPF0276 family)
MTLVGIAYSGYVPELIEACPDQLDFVEVPFELLRHNPQALHPLKSHRVILHCASLNIAGPVRPGAELVDCLREWIGITRTPWVGEHLAFITASPDKAVRGAEEHAPGEPYNLGFTMSPPMNSATARSVVEVTGRYGRELSVPLLLENSPLYFDIPGSSMCQVDFVREICKGSDVRLLLDLTHFYITSRNMGFDAFRALEKYPLDRVDEIHISGASDQCDVWWDDHACPASDEVFELLALATRRVTPRAITLEYNWSARFPLDTVMSDIKRIRKVIGRG